MRQSLRLLRVAGIPVGAHWSALVIAVLIALMVGGTLLPEAAPGERPDVYWAVAVVTAIVFLAALLAHEMAHALVARRYGVGVRAITLWALGGVAEIEGEAPTPRAELAIAAAGPLTSLGAAGVFWLAAVGAEAAQWPAVVQAALVWLAFINVLLAVFNMLPGAPLDGGRVLHAVLWWKYGDRARADQAAARAGQALGTALIAIGVVQAVLLAWLSGLWLALIGWFLINAARAEAVGLAARRALSGLRVRDVMTPHPDVAPGWHSVGSFAWGTALLSRQTVFPVVDPAGAPLGFVVLDTLAAVPPANQGATRIDAIAIPVPADRVFALDDDVVAALEHLALAGELVGLVVDEGRVVGMLTTADLARVMRQAPLRAQGYAAD